MTNYINITLQADNAKTLIINQTGATSPFWGADFTPCLDDTETGIYAPTTTVDIFGNQVGRLIPSTPPGQRKKPEGKKTI